MEHFKINAVNTNIQFRFQGVYNNMYMFHRVTFPIDTVTVNLQLHLYLFFTYLYSR